MLKLRRGLVAEVVELPSAHTEGIAHVIVDVSGELRAAFADTGLVGTVAAGDDVVVNVEAVDLSLGSGGEDVVVVNLTRGLGVKADPDHHVMKLNYTPLQHGVATAELAELTRPIAKPAAIFQLHAQLPCVAWSAMQRNPDLKIGYVQTAGGALPGALSRTVRDLRELGLICDHLTAGPAYGGQAEAISTIGAIHAGLAGRGWDCALVGPGPGILGSATALGHGGMVALDSAHAALALGCETILVARASAGDPRERHRGISHHTETVLELLLAPVTVPISSNAPEPVHGKRHRVVPIAVNLGEYVASGLPDSTMGRNSAEDPLFFEQGLAAGVALADAVAA